MALTLEVIPGYTAEVGKPITVDDLNLGFTPTINLQGAVGSADIQDGSIRINHLYSEFLKGAQASSAVVSTDLLLLGTSAGTANRSVTVGALLSGMWSSPLLYGEFNDWDADRVLWQTEAGEVRAIAPSGLASSLVRQAALASVLGDYAANLVGVNQSSGATAMKIADFAKALITQAPAFVSPEVLAGADEIVVVDVSAGKAIKTTVGALATAARPQFRSGDISLPTTAGSAADPVTHGLSTAPQEISFQFRCATAENGYVPGDLIPGSAMSYQYEGSNVNVVAFIVRVTATQILLSAAAAAANVRMSHATTGVEVTPVLANWRARITVKT